MRLLTAAGELDLFPAQDSNDPKTLCNFAEITLARAWELGLPFMGSEPSEAEVACECCGKALPVTGFYFQGHATAMQPKECDCPGAQARRLEQERLVAEAEAEERRQEQLAYEQQRINKLIGQSGIRKRFQQRTFDRFKTDTKGREYGYRVAKDYADNFDKYLETGTGLYIEGSYGTGKTHLAAAIAIQLLGEKRPVICKTSIDLLADIKKAFGDGNEAEIMKTYRRAQLLVIDDFGKEQCTEWSSSTMYSIINERYESMMPTIITTNFNKRDLIRQLSVRSGNSWDSTRIEAIISRLTETSIGLSMAWEDWRGK